MRFETTPERTESLNQLCASCTPARFDRCLREASSFARFQTLCGQPLQIAQTVRKRWEWDEPTPSGGVQFDVKVDANSGRNFTQTKLRTSRPQSCYPQCFAFTGSGLVIEGGQEWNLRRFGIVTQWVRCTTTSAPVGEPRTLDRQRRVKLSRSSAQRHAPEQRARCPHQLRPPGPRTQEPLAKPDVQTASAWRRNETS